MRVLIAVGSKHGATAEIGAAVGEVLTAQGIESIVVDIEEASAPEGFDAAVIGSAVYAGHWTKPARRYVETHQDRLADLPVWLFSSGPIGDPPQPEEDPVDLPEMMDATRAVEHRVFSGKLDKSQLGFAERAIVRAFKAPEGDYRDWEQVRSWADGIAQRLHLG